jgi:hypothetical protein
LDEQDQQILLGNRMLCERIARSLDLVPPEVDLSCDSFSQQTRILQANSTVLQKAIELLMDPKKK